MKKRNYLYPVILLLYIAPLSANAQSINTYQSTFSGPLKNWAQTFTHFNLTHFKQVSKRYPFENINSVKVKSKATFFPGYKSALCTSPNGQYVIDIYSYLLLEKKNGKFTSTGSDVEQNITLGNIPERSWKRIDYFGYAQRAQKVCWINNDTFILAAARLNKVNRNIPVIIIGHIKTQSLTTFETTNPDCYQKPGSYTSPKLIALHIQVKDH
ncbi:hypothetical protein SAMN05216464_103228 [Mucilaginibacter pineti]|uniref:Uncharacterized protein n=2 Tax=Mucilaginibacter pineti TaxID=1391627 RepID=A0A1G6Z7X5_9SPHI|nr:hypothetical protein SAMN05216464_103228 [Mucilaginibacter pineti]